MKITFLIPPCFDNKFAAERSSGCTRVVYPMINIYELTVAAAAREMAGWQTELQDFVYDEKPVGDFDRFLADDNSDAYAIWTVNLSMDSDIEAVSHIRKFHHQTPVILMGPGATHYISKGLVDSGTFIVRGEPELTLIELLGHFASGSPELAEIKGLSYKDDKGTVRNNPSRPLNDNLDALPFPARDLLGNRTYHNPKLKRGPYTAMFTSRNCPYQCIYCVPSSLTFAREIEYGREHSGRKPTIGFRSIESIEKEVDMLAAEGYKAIGFMDDNFIWNEERTREICRIMRKHGIVWGCQARVDAITEPIAKMLGESGCLYVDLGVESFDPEILKYVKKGISPDDIYRAVGLLKKYKVPVKLNVLIGSSPLETKESILHTLHEAKRLKVDQVMFNIVSPFPGTKYYEVCKENGWIKGGEYRPTDVQHDSILNLPNVSAKEMERLLLRNNLSFFLTPSFVWKQMRRFSSWTEFTAALKALRIKLFHR